MAESGFTAGIVIGKALSALGIGLANSPTGPVGKAIGHTAATA